MTAINTAPQKIVRTTLKVVLLHRDDVDPSSMSLLKILKQVNGEKQGETRLPPTLLGVFTRSGSEEIFGEDEIVLACNGLNNDGSFFLDLVGVAGETATETEAASDDDSNGESDEG